MKRKSFDRMNRIKVARDGPSPGGSYPACSPVKALPSHPVQAVHESPPSAGLEHETLTRTIIGAAMRVHNVLGPGFLESVYQNALARELQLRAVPAECERPLTVRYRGAVVGEFAADMLVAGAVLVENKAVRAIAPAHEAQLVNYLTATGVAVGLLFNFGAERLELRRKFRAYAPPRARHADEP